MVTEKDLHKLYEALLELGLIVKELGEVVAVLENKIENLENKNVR